MKRIFLILLAVMICMISSASLADPIGFGYVNNTDVALRRGIGGKVLVRLPEDTCVWIQESATDSHGNLWYHINAGLHVDYTNVDYTGWMKAEFINAGDTVWHDVVSVAATGHGMIALRSDGSAESTNGEMILRTDGEEVIPNRWIRSIQNVKQVETLSLGREYLLLTGDGTLYSTGPLQNPVSEKLAFIGTGELAFGITPDGRIVSLADLSESPVWRYPETVPDSSFAEHIVRMTGSYCRMLLLADDGRLYVFEYETDLDSEPEPDWSEWTDLQTVNAGYCKLKKGSDHHQAAYAAVHRDGTVLAAPKELADIIGGWTDMKEIRISPYWVLGLRNDGTALTVAVDGASNPPDVSHWTDVVSIGAGMDYCVGIRKDGTLVFAGDHIFMGEGHNRQ